MKRTLICTLACHLILSTVSGAQESKMKSLWPLGKNKATTAPSYDNINPFTTPTSIAKNDKRFSMPSPTKAFSKAGDNTESVFTKTRNSWKEFSKHLNPFASKKKTTAKKKNGGSFMDRFLPKKDPAPPATVGEFLSMKRPSL